ncbi:MAG: diguanylate cyclase [Planctomycetota bacterium]
MSTSTSSRLTGLTPELMTPAMPTDTSGVLIRMLALSEDLRRQQTLSGDKQIIPRTLMTLLLRSMKAQDFGTLLHGQRIAAISSGVAKLLGWDDDQRRQLEVAALLHDIGKLGVPEHIISKPGKLSSEEYDFVLLHHHAAVSLLQAFHTDPAVIAMLSMLHHDFDGSGIDVPSSATLPELPLGPRILAVADAYDSLSTPKPYRRGMTHKEAINVLEERSGSRYDGNIVRTLNRWYEAEGDSLFRFTDPFSSLEPKQPPSEQQRNEIVLLSQFINVLYQFQELYDGYFILDSHENYCIWSDGMPGMTGLPMQSVLGRSWQPMDVQLVSLTDDTAAPEVRENTMVGQTIRNGRPQFASKLCRVGDSRHLKVDVHTMPILGPNGGVYGIVQLLRNKSGVRRQSREYVELKLAATRDALTGVANRGQLETQLRHLLEDYHTNEGTRPLSTIFLDVDKFKRINDTFGHQVGDQVLVDLTRLIQHETYSGEIIGRYGGEEFVVICPDTDLEGAVRRAERLRHAVIKSSIGGISTLNVTSSFGVSTTRLGDTVQTLLERADNCLYRAKETGRNRTCWESQDASEPTEKGTAEEAKPVIENKNGSFEFREKIEVSTSLELTAMKLQAFIREYKAQILGQDHGNMKIRLGSLGFTRRWGSNFEKQPIDVSIMFDTCRTISPLDGKPRTIHKVSIAVTPFGKTPDGETFAHRCGILMRDLRAYLLGS